MVTVEVDPVRVESRLAAGEIECPLCGDAVLAGWGHARARWIDGLEDSPRPRRARCGTCQAMHMLLPVTVPPGRRRPGRHGAGAPSERVRRGTSAAAPHLGPTPRRRAG